MNFHFDVNAMVSTLPIMLYGMLGGLIVMLVIAGLLTGLYRFGKRNQHTD